MVLVMTALAFASLWLVYYLTASASKRSARRTNRSDRRSSWPDG
jgi:hypothetical protein